MKNKILDELAENKKDLHLGGEVFNGAFTESDVKVGVPIQQLIQEMKKASNEKLIKVKPEDNASYC